MNSTRNLPFGRPWIEDEERDAVSRVLNGHILTHGPQCQQFEQQFQAHLNGGYCLSVSSCTAALHLIYLHYGIGLGDEVIVPAQTHTATAHAVEFVGAKPIFVDCCADTGNIDPSIIETNITANTKAISVVHFLGIPCDMDKICAIAAKYHLKVIEDCALAIGTIFRDQPVGLWGDAGAFSFYPVKHITTAEGGMLVTKHLELYESTKLLRAFGVDKSHNERDVPGMYDVKTLGYNYRMSEMQAALGTVQIRRVPEILRRRKNNFNLLAEILADIKQLRVIRLQDNAQQSSHYCLSVILKNELARKRKEFVLQLKDRGIGTSIYYPQPVPRMTYYRTKYGYQQADFVNATEISDASIALPVGPHLNRDDIEYIGSQCHSVAAALLT